MTEKNHFAALQEIRKWNTDDVICALKNNGLGECVDACKKREITGEKLLKLSEMEIGLWKRDLSTPNIRKLARFIQDISKMPGKYIGCTVSSGDDAWDTDFDDDEIEEDNGQKSENNIPHSLKLEKKSRLFCASSQENVNSSVHNLVNKNYNTQKNGNHLSSVNRNITSLHRNKINIPKAFSDVQSSENSSSTNSPLRNTSFSKVNGFSESMEIEKPNEMKNLKPSVPSRPPNGFSESMEIEKPNEMKNLKPSVPSRPPSLHVKTSPQESPRSTLPKPPEFDNEGLVLREICDKLSLEPDLVDEYESIDDDLLHTQNIKSQISGFKILAGSQNSAHQSSLESHQKSSVFQNSFIDLHQHDMSPFSLHRNNVSQKINTLPQISKTDITIALENMRKSPILSRALIKKEEETLQTSKNSPLVCQEKQAFSHSSPIPLPPRNETKQDVSPTSTLHLQSSINALRLNHRPVITVTSETSRKSNVHEEQEEKNDINENTLHEDVYESIPEHTSRKSMGVENGEDYSGYLQPIAPPSLPPKPKQASYIKSSEKLINGESCGAALKSWHFGTQFKTPQKSQEKASPDGKKNNTLPKPRPLNSCVSETSRPSASRPLPPPPIPDGNVQRLGKIPLEQMPWYFNVDRTRGKEILRNCEDGTFMVRPSTQNALTLSLKYGARSFNICVRVRPDGKFALGTAKPTEQTFSSVEELVNYYTTNELLLYSNGKQAGIVVLTSPPRKDGSQ